MTEHHLAPRNVREKRRQDACVLPKLRKMKSSTYGFARSALECDASSHRFLKHHKQLKRCLDAMNNAFVLQDVASFAEIIANIGLRFDPLDVTRDTFVEIDGRFVTS